MFIRHTYNLSSHYLLSADMSMEDWSSDSLLSITYTFIVKHCIIIISSCFVHSLLFYRHLMLLYPLALYAYTN